MEQRRLCGAVIGKAAAYAASAVCIISALVLYARYGASPWRAVCVWAVAALTVLLPGRLFTRFFLPHEPRPVRAASALVFGTVSFVAVTLVSCALRTTAISFAWVLLCAAVWLVLWPRGAVRDDGADTGRTAHGGSALRGTLGRTVFALRRGNAAADAARRRFLKSADGAALVLLWGVLVLLNALWAAHYAHPSAVGSLVPSQDFFWNLGNAESFLLGLPLADLRVAGVTIQYHFLTELFQAGLAGMTGVKIYDAVAFYSYAPIAAAMLTSLYALGRTLWDTPDKAAPHGEEKAHGKASAECPKALCGAVHFRALALAALPLWLCCASLWKSLGGASRFGNSLLLYVISNQNAQATALLFCAAFLLFFERLSRTDFRTPRLLAAAAAAFYLLTFSKSPQAGILALAVLCALVLAAFRREASKCGFAALLVLIPIGFFVLYEFYFASTADSCMKFSLTGSLNVGFFASILGYLKARFPGLWGAFWPLLLLAQTFLMAPLACAVWLWAALHDITRLSRVSPSRLVWHAAAAGGILAYFLFDHYSMSQAYFANIGLVCMGLVMLDALPALWDTVRRRSSSLRTAAVGGALALAAASLVTALCLTFYVSRDARLRVRGGMHDENRLVLTADDETACTWLHAQMRPEERFATNRMHTGAALEGLSNVYSGLSGRQAYFESFKYAVADMDMLMERYAQTEELFSENTSPARAEQLCTDNGIAYLLYCPAAPGSDRSLREFDRVYQSDSLVIYRTAKMNAPRTNKQK